MGLLAAIDHKIRNATYKETEGWFADWARDGEGSPGPHVTTRNAMQIAIVWNAVNWRAKIFGAVPKKVKENVEILGRPAQREARSHPLFNLVNRSPNPTITSYGWFSLISADLHLHGNSYAWQQRGSSSGKLQHCWRFRPDMVRPALDEDSSELVYWVKNYAGGETKFLAGEMLHFHGLGFDGIQGYAPITLLRKELKWTVQTRDFSSNYYENVFRPSGLLMSPTTLKIEQRKELVASLRATGKDGGLSLIEGAMEYKPLTIPQDDAQFLETVMLQDERLAGIMEVKPHKIGIMRHMTNNNVEQQNIESTTDCIHPFAVNVEETFNLQALSDSPSSGRGGGTEQDRFFVECELKGLMRGDTASQTAHIKEMIGSGVYSPNDGRDYLSLPPIEGGDVYVINRAYGPLDSIDEWVMTSQNNSPASEPAKDSTKAAVKIDIAAIRRCTAIPFRDAVSKIAARSKDREKFALSVVSPVFHGLAAGLNVKLDEEYAGRYLTAFAKRSVDWKTESADSTAEAELTRAFDELVELGQAAEYFKERTCDA